MDNCEPKKYCVAEIRKDHGKAYEKWSGEDDMKLESGRIDGKSIAELAISFGRNKGAISSRLRKMGIK